MSKIGRKPISTRDITVTVDGQVVSYIGAKKTGSYLLPDCLRVVVESDLIRLELTNSADKKNNNVWGLHRALLANDLKGCHEEFVEEVVIVGLGYKGELKGNIIAFKDGTVAMDFKRGKYDIFEFVNGLEYELDCFIDDIVCKIMDNKKR